ncbi:MAG: hypothetical protein OSB66_02335 [SAR202 cluster bacterium]|nr:hypothetical protein [SAR202 cluster bacterium]
MPSCKLGIIVAQKVVEWVRRILFFQRHFEEKFASAFLKELSNLGFTANEQFIIPGETANMDYYISSPIRVHIERIEYDGNM